MALSTFNPLEVAADDDEVEDVFSVMELRGEATGGQVWHTKEDKKKTSSIKIQKNQIQTEGNVYDRKGVFGIFGVK